MRLVPRINRKEQEGLAKKRRETEGDDNLLNPLNPLSPISPFNPFSEINSDVSVPDVSPSTDPPSVDWGNNDGFGGGGADGSF